MSERAMFTLDSVFKWFTQQNTTRPERSASHSYSTEKLREKGRHTTWTGNRNKTGQTTFAGRVLGTVRAQTILARNRDGKDETTAENQERKVPDQPCREQGRKGHDHFYWEQDRGKVIQPLEGTGTAMGQTTLAGIRDGQCTKHPCWEGRRKGPDPDYNYINEENNNKQ